MVTPVCLILPSVWFPVMQKRFEFLRETATVHELAIKQHTYNNVSAWVKAHVEAYSYWRHTGMQPQRLAPRLSRFIVLFIVSFERACGT